MKHNVKIARSGVQYYGYNELANLGLATVPAKHKDKRVFAVYRPSYVLDKLGTLCKEIPVVIGHEHWIETKSDEEKYVIGKTEPKIDVVCDGGEVVLSTKIDVDDDRLPDCAELSLGYVSKNEWCEGVAPNGEPFQIVCDSVKDVNHLAIVERARGGEGLRILDNMGIRSGLLHFFRRFGKQCDSTGSAFADAIVQLKSATLTEADALDCVNVLSACLQDLPNSIEKAKLERYIADIPLLLNETDCSLILDKIQEVYTNLSRDAIDDVLTMQNNSSALPTTSPSSSIVPNEQQGGIESGVTTENQGEDMFGIKKPAPQADTAPVVPTSAPQQSGASIEDVMTALQAIMTLLQGFKGTSSPAPQAESSANEESKESSSESSGEGETKDENAPNVSVTENKTQDSAMKEKPKAQDSAETKVNDSLAGLYTQSFETKASVDELDNLFNRIKGGR